MKKIHIDKWRAIHLRELVIYYLDNKYPSNNYVLQKNGNLVYYEKSPKWFARMINRVTTIPFKDVIKEIWESIYGEQVNDIDFANLYIYGSIEDLIDVTFYLHITSVMKCENDQLYDSCKTNKNQVHVNRSGIIDANKGDEFNIALADGVYNVKQYFITRMEDKTPSIEEIVKFIKDKNCKR